MQKASILESKKERLILEYLKQEEAFENQNRITRANRHRNGVKLQKLNDSLSRIENDRRVEEQFRITRKELTKQLADQRNDTLEKLRSEHAKILVNLSLDLRAESTPSQLIRKTPVSQVQNDANSSYIQGDTQTPAPKVILGTKKPRKKLKGLSFSVTQPDSFEWFGQSGATTSVARKGNAEPSEALLSGKTLKPPSNGNQMPLEIFRNPFPLRLPIFANHLNKSAGKPKGQNKIMSMILTPLKNSAPSARASQSSHKPQEFTKVLLAEYKRVGDEGESFKESIALFVQTAKECDAVIENTRRKKDYLSLYCIKK